MNNKLISIISFLFISLFPACSTQNFIIKNGDAKETFLSSQTEIGDSKACYTYRKLSFYYKDPLDRIIINSIRIDSNLIDGAIYKVDLKGFQIIDDARRELNVNLTVEDKAQIEKEFGINGVNGLILKRVAIGEKTFLYKAELKNQKLSKGAIESKLIFYYITDGNGKVIQKEIYKSADKQE